MLQDEAELSTYVTEDDQTIHMMAKTAPPQSQPQPQPNSQGQTASTGPGQQQNQPGMGPFTQSQMPFQPRIQGASNIIISTVGPGGIPRIGDLINNLTANVYSTLKFNIIC